MSDFGIRLITYLNYKSPSARSRWREAHEVVEYVADHAGDELRPTFLALPRASKILANSDVNTR